MLRIGLKRTKSEKKQSKRLKSKINTKYKEKREDDQASVPLGDTVTDKLEKQLEVAVFGQDDDVFKILELSHRVCMFSCSFFTAKVEYFC